MLDQFWWSIFLDLVGLIPIILVGKHKRSGWLWYIAWMGMWIWYGIDVGAWGFIPSSLIYSVLYFRNWWKWQSVKKDS